MTQSNYVWVTKYKDKEAKVNEPIPQLRYVQQGKGINYLDFEAFVFVMKVYFKCNQTDKVDMKGFGWDT